MALKEDYLKLGQLLFRIRSYIPLILIPFYIIVIYVQVDKPFYFSINLFFCALISLCGITVRIFTICFVPPNTSGRNVQRQVADTLNTTGFYSIVRHPLYLGNYIIWLGISLYTASPVIVLLTLCFYWLYYEIIMFTEEEYLRDKFGIEFEDWANRVPAIIPNFKHFKKCASHFSLKKVIRQENDGVYALIITFFFLKLIKEFSETSTLTADYCWLITVIISTILYIILKIIKKKTNLLKDQRI